MNEKPPIGMNDLNALAKRYLVPPLIDNLYGARDLADRIPRSRRNWRWRLREGWYTASERIRYAWRVLKGDWPDF